MLNAGSSWRGERSIERLLSASVTCRLQGRSLFAYLSDVLAANIRGDPFGCSPDSAGDVNAYQKLTICRENVVELTTLVGPAGLEPATGRL